MPTQTDQLPSFPMPRPSPLHPPAGYGRIREAGGLGRVHMFDGRVAWLVTRHDQIRTLLADPRVSADVRNEHFPFSSPARAAVGREGRTFITMDGAEHLRLRRVFTGYFSVRRIEQLRPRIQQIVEEIIDQMVASPPPADLVRDLSLEVPARVVCAVLGIPERDREYFQTMDGARNRLSTPEPVVAEATAGMLALVDRLIADKLEHPDDGLISALVHEKMTQGAITREQLAPAIRLLITAGHETTANMISLSVLTLLQHPEELAALVRTPELVPGAVEELLRYISVFHISPTRVATEPIEIDGTRIEAGDGLILVAAGANRDPAAFPDPDVLDLDRDARRHVAFGYGVHQCLGQSLARIELQAVIGTLFQRISTLRLAVPFDSVVLDDYAFLRLIDLPVTWDATTRGARR